VGGAGISGNIERTDSEFCRECRASSEVDWRAGNRGSGDSGLVPGGKASRWAVCAKVVAFLAALVSPPVFPFLFRRAGTARAPDFAGLERRELDRVRSLADGRASRRVARAIRDAGAERLHAVHLSDVFSVPVSAGRNSVLPAGLGGLLVGDDVFRSGVRHRLCDRDPFSDRESLVRDGRRMAWGAAWRRVYGGNQFHRAFRARTGRGVSFGACSGLVRGAVGSMAAPEMAFLGDAAVGVVHVRVHGVGKVSLRGGYFRGNDYRDAWIFDRAVGDGEKGGG